MEERYEKSDAHYGGRVGCGAGLGRPRRVQAQQSNMTFFVTSVGKGNGADLGGLDGADAHCQALAKAAGSKLTNWRAYLSTTAPGGDAGVNARDRIGKGPWQQRQGRRWWPRAWTTCTRTQTTSPSRRR